jgi:hypothetical protein
MSEAVLGPIEELNPYAHIAQESRPIDSLDDSFFQDFNVILMSACSQVGWMMHVCMYEFIYLCVWKKNIGQYLANFKIFYVFLLIIVCSMYMYMYVYTCMFCRCG